MGIYENHNKKVFFLKQENRKLRQALAALVNGLKIVVVERKEKFSKHGESSVFVWDRIEQAIADAEDALK